MNCTMKSHKVLQPEFEALHCWKSARSCQVYACACCFLNNTTYCSLTQLSVKVYSFLKSPIIVSFLPLSGVFYWRWKIMFQYRNYKIILMTHKPQIVSVSETYNKKTKACLSSLYEGRRCLSKGVQFGWMLQQQLQVLLIWYMCVFLTKLW